MAKFNEDKKYIDCHGEQFSKTHSRQHWALFFFLKAILHYFTARSKDNRAPTSRHLSMKSLLDSQGICKHTGLFFIESKKKFR